MHDLNFTLEADASSVTSDPDSGQELTRRVVLRGAAVSGVALPLLAACGSGADSGASDSPEGSGSSSRGNTPAGGTTVAATDVPVGGGKILAEASVVVTQPAEGEFRAFSATCTHKGCPVKTISEGQIQCPCHGSAFSVEDGSVLKGPAERPLENLSATLDGGTITVG